MKKRIWALSIALALAVTGCTAAAAAAASYDDRRPAPVSEAEEQGYVLTEYEGGIGVWHGQELILTLPVELESLRKSDRELIRQGISSGDFQKILGLLEDFGS